jgi:hypothetical protein
MTAQPVDRAAKGSGWAAALIASLLTPRGVVAVWCVYALTNAIVRLTFSRTLSYHDAIASALTHGLQFGYQKGQPPLWEWMLASAQLLLGTGIESHLLVRYGTIALIGIGLYRASVAASGSVRWSAAVSFSVVLSYQLGWRQFEGGTQAVVLAAACLFTLDAALRHVARPGWKTALYLGVAIGAGFLSKFSFALFMTALVVALLLRRETRSGLVNRWSLVALGVAVLVVLPYALWFIQHSVSIGEVVQQRLVRTNESHLLRAAMGLRSLFANMPAFLAPWFLVIAGLWWMGRRMDTPTKAGGAAEGVLRDTMLIALAITLTGIVAVGVKHFTVPYLNFLMMPIFPLAAAVLARSGPRDGAELLAAIAVIAMVILTCARIYVLGVGGTSANRSFGPHFPYPALAGALTQRGLAEGTIVAFSARDAGNLRAYLPRAEVLWQGSTERAAEKRMVPARRTCVVVDDAGGAAVDALENAAGRTAAKRFPSAAGSRETIEVPWQATLRATPRTMRWTLIRVDPADPICTED